MVGPYTASERRSVFDPILFHFQPLHNWLPIRPSQTADTQTQTDAHAEEETGGSDDATGKEEKEESDGASRKEGSGGAPRKEEKKHVGETSGGSNQATKEESKEPSGESPDSKTNTTTITRENKPEPDPPL